MQVTYLEAFLRIRSFQAVGPGAFLAWLRRIADHNLRDAIKGLQRQKRPPPGRCLGQVSGDSAVDLLARIGVTTTTPSRAAAGRELHTLLQDALAALPADYAAVVRLYDLEAWPISDVAARLARSPGAVHMLRSRAHLHLRALLGSQSRFFSNGA
jgi:RNA polymerase sigma factor (sigma-70 family)